MEEKVSEEMATKPSRVVRCKFKDEKVRFTHTTTIAGGDSKARQIRWDKDECEDSDNCNMKTCKANQWSSDGTAQWWEEL